MPMTDELPGRGARVAEAEAMHDVIEPALHDAQQDLAGVLRRARRQFEVAAELPLQHAVEAFQFLLLAQAHAVLARFPAPVAVHAGRAIAPVDGALGAFATGPLEEEL